MNTGAEVQEKTSPGENRKAEHEASKKELNRNVGFNSTKRKSSLSINSILKDKGKEEKEKKDEDLSSKPKENFGVDDLMNKWNSYANRIKHDGKTNLHATLTKHKPELKPNFVIELTLDNTVQEEVLATEKMEFLDYLRSELNNYQIQLKTVLIKTESGNALYTTRDKFEKLAEKNPSLNKLKDLLNLDLDY